MTELAVAAMGIYLAVGFLFAIAFAWRGARTIDPDAVEATWGFRLMVLPGATLLWPVLLGRWLRAAPPPVERTAHKVAAEEQR